MHLTGGIIGKKLCYPWVTPLAVGPGLCILPPWGCFPYGGLKGPDPLLSEKAPRAKRECGLYLCIRGVLGGSRPFAHRACGMKEASSSGSCV